MGLKIETWNIAYRKRTKGVFDRKSSFTVIKNGHKGWYADPFLFEYNDDIFLFAEYYSYKLKRGIISVSKYNKTTDKFEKFTPIIVENYHLSYPVVFNYKGDVYMMPESGESNSLYMYKCKSFPNEWEKMPLAMSNIRLVDTTPYIKGDNFLALSLRISDPAYANGDLVLLKYDGSKFDIISDKPLSSDMSFARPGGNFFSYEDVLYYPSQNCDGEYGKSLNIVKLSDGLDASFNYAIEDKVLPEEISLIKGKTPQGLHTYNICDEFEVIDLKYYKNSFYRLIYRLLKR